jgi:hypothetical protein
MDKKRKKRALLKLLNKRHELVWVDADDWDAVFNICKAVRAAEDNGKEVTEQDRVEDILWRIDIDQADDEKRIVGFNVPFKEFLSAFPQCSVATLDALKKLTVTWNHFDSVRKSPLPCWPLGIECLANLEELKLAINCHVSIHNIFPCARPRITPFPKLSVLDLGDCHHLSEIPEEIGLLGPTLQHLKLSLRPTLRFAAGATNTLPTSIKIFPMSMCQLVHLKRFHAQCTTVVPAPTVYGLDARFIFPFWRQLEAIHMDIEAVDLLFHGNSAIPSAASSSSTSFLTGDDHTSISSTHAYWPLLKVATITLPSLLVHQGPDLHLQQDRLEVVSSALKKLATWTQLQNLHFIFQKNMSPTAFTSPCCLPLSLLRPLGQNHLVEMTILTSSLSEPLSWRPTFSDFSLEDVASLSHLEIFRARGCRLTSPPIDSGTASASVKSCSPLPLPKLTRLELEECSGFFTSSALDVVSSLDLSKLQVLCLSKLKTEFGDTEYTTLCRKVLTQCSNIQELDLSNGNVYHLDGISVQDCAGDLLISSLATANESLRVLDLNGNPALSLPEGNRKEKEANIQALWYWVARFPYLGYLGKFNELFLGRLGENYNRLGEYYRLVHHLAINRAQSRILMGQTVPLGLWAKIFEKAQRAFDDYPGHVLARNRKEVGDAIFHLLRERGAKDIFFNF